MRTSAKYSLFWYTFKSLLAYLYEWGVQKLPWSYIQKTRRISVYFKSVSSHTNACTHMHMHTPGKLLPSNWLGNEKHLCHEFCFFFFTLISSGCWGWLNIWGCSVCDGEGSVGSDDVADRLTGSAPWILGWKGIAWCLGYAMLGALSFLNKTHLNKVQLIRLAWLIRFLSRLLASAVWTSCPGYAASA